MKLLIGAVVALLCMQTIKAFPQAEQIEEKSEVKSTDKGEDKCEDQCKRELKCRKDKENAFFQEFERKHDDAYDDLASAAKTFALVKDLFEKISCTKPKPTECQIARLIKFIYSSYLYSVEHLNSLSSTLAELDVDSDEQRCKEKYVCKKDCRTEGCEAETNKLICDLIGFHNDVDVIVVQGKNITSNLIQAWDEMYQVARKYDCKNKPRCDDEECSCGRRHESRTVNCFVDDFIPAFKCKLATANELMLQDRNLCQTVRLTISGFLCRTEN